MNSFKFVDDHVELETVPKKFKKLTATRFATVMGLNAWSTPFEAWCEITRTWEKPFEETIYTKAGKVIEPKVIEYLKNVMFMDIKSPTEVYGADYFKKTWGDFFPDQKELGGMWDALGDDFIVEIKTTKRAEDWKLDVPIYYKLQACLYAYLLGFDNVIMTVSFLEDKDYVNPEAFVPSFKNTKIYEFKVSEAFPTFKKSYIEPALKFWKDHVETGISPQFDEKRDAEILKALRTNEVESTDKDISKLMAEADRLKVSIDKAEEKIKDKKDRLKEIDDQVKKYMSNQFRDGDKKVEMAGKKYTWTLTKSQRKSVDTAKLKGVMKEYLIDEKDVYKTTETLTLKKSIIEEE